MNSLIDLLKNQTTDSFNWTNKLIDSITDEKWFISPEVIDSNIAWQIGHLTLSQYYYTIVLLNGPNKDLAEKLDLKKYSVLFSNGLKRNELSSELTVDELKQNWNLIQKQTLESIDLLKDKDLNDAIFQLPKPHPFVKTKENSISWNIKHTMWHCGQIATLKRIVDQPMSFGM